MLREMLRFDPARSCHARRGEAQLLGRVAAVVLALTALDATLACGRERRAAPAPVSDESATGTPEPGEAHWPEHGQAAPEVSAQAASLPGYLILATEHEAWHLTPRTRAVRSLAGLTKALGAELSLYPTSAVTADGGLVWIVARGHDDERLQQVVVQRGDRLTPLGPVARYLSHVSLTRDGKRLLLAASYQSFRDLYLLELGSGALARLTDDREGNFDPSLATDGDTLVFASSRDGDSEIYAMTVPATMPSQPPPVTRLTAFHRDDFAPVHGPNQQVAFVSDREGVDRVFVVRADGTGLRRASDETDPAVNEAGPSWSSRGELVLRRVAGGRSELRLVAGGPARSLTPPGVTVVTYAWEPSGQWLAVLEEPVADPTKLPTGRARASLWAVRRDGGQRVLISPAVDDESVVRWLAEPAPPPSK